MTYKRCVFLVSLTSATLVVLIPVLLGYGWNAFHPRTPHLVGQTVPNSRPSNGEISIEFFGTGVIEVGLSARIDDYLTKGVLPLWNPRQGLGQPAAMGEGDPFWPPRIVRALVHYTEEIFVALIVLVVSGVAMFGLLRLLDTSPVAASLGASLWVTNGSLLMHLARPNIFDQVAMFPVLFLGIAYSMRRRTATSFLLAAFTSGAFALAGFPQVGALGLIGAAIFAVVSALCEDTTNKQRLVLLGIGCGTLALGVGLSAFYLVPLFETVLTAWAPRGSLHGYLPIPLSNWVSFFFPVAAGQPQHNWMPGAYPDVTDWNNLYGHSSNVTLFLICIGLVSLPRMPRRTRITFLCFFACGVAFHMKYISLPPFSLFNRLPVVGTITPKHVNGLTAFLFAVAASLALDHLDRERLRYAVWLLVAFVFACAAIIAFAIYKVHDSGPYDLPLAFASISLTAMILCATVTTFVVVARHKNIDDFRAWPLVLATIVSEAVAYLLLGNATTSFIWSRAAVICAVYAVGFMVAVGFRRLAAATAFAATVGYVMLLVLPTYGLPNRVDLRIPEKYMMFLKEKDVDQYRTFGINADFSAVGSLNDLSAAGPFAPYSFLRFVHVVSEQKFSHFYDFVPLFWFDPGNSMAPPFPAIQYLQMKPIFDWVGVKYLVLDKEFFRVPRRTDQLLLLADSAGLSTIYEDERVQVLKSEKALPKAEFYTSIVPYDDNDESKLIRMLKENPALVTESALVPSSMGLSEGSGGKSTVTILSSEPNQISMRANVTSRGILVVKEAFSPGWQALVNGKLASIIPIAGIVQGVYIPQAGQYEIIISYRPMGFIIGAVISSAALLVAIGTLLYSLVVKNRRRDSHV